MIWPAARITRVPVRVMMSPIGTPSVAAGPAAQVAT